MLISYSAVPRKVLNLTINYYVPTHMAHECLRSFVTCGKKIMGAMTNYKALAKILKLPIPSAPVIFMKPTTSYIEQGVPIIIPQGFTVNFKAELGVVIGKICKDVSEKDALNFTGIALDMTAASELTEARNKGLPWVIGKGFDTACPVGCFIPKCEFPDPANVNIWGKLNEFPVSHLISYISKYITLEPNDLILTGSPPGMGPVAPGDIVECGIEGFDAVKFEVTEAQCT